MADIKINVQVIQGQAKAALSGLANQANQTAKAVDGLNINLKSAGSAMSSFIGNLGANAFQSVISSIRGLIGSTFDLTAELETTTTQFEVLTGSAKIAERVLKDLQQFSAETPFQFNEIASAAKRLISFGFAADDVKNKLQFLGDISAASGANINELSLIFGQVSAAGKLTGERLLQLQERAIPIGPAIAKTMNVAESAVRKLVSEGKVDFATFERAFKSLNKEGEFAFEGMKKRSETLEGRISTLKDNFALLQQEIGQKLLPVLKLGVEALIGMIQAVKESAAVQSLIVGITVAMTGFASAALYASGAFALLAKGAAAAWVAITGPIGLIVGGVALVAAGVFYLYKNWEQVRIGILKAWKAAKDFLGLNTEALALEIQLSEAILRSKKREEEANKTGKTQQSELNELRREKLDLVKAEVQQVKMLTDEEIKAQQAALERETKFASDILSIKQKRYLAEYEAKLQADGDLSELDKIAILQKEDQLAREFEARQLENQQKLIDQDIQLNAERVRLEEHQNQLAILEETFATNRITRQNTINSALQAQDKKAKDKQENDEKRFKEQLKALNEKYEQQKLNLLTAGGNLAAAVAKDGSKAQFLIQKATAVAGSFVAGQLAVAQARATPPGPPYTEPLAQRVQAISNLNTAAIVATAIKGFENGGIVGGNSFSGDNVMARVNSGEMILNRQQQSNLFNIAQGRASGNQINETHITVELDGEVVGRAVSRQVANGLKLGEVV